MERPVIWRMIKEAVESINSMASNTDIKEYGIIGFMVQMLKKPILKRIPSRSTPLRRATTIKTLLKIICTIKPIIPKEYIRAKWGNWS